MPVTAILASMKLAHLNRIIIGCWQLSAGHTRHEVAGLDVIEAYYAAGFRTFDCADIYTGVENLLGTFIKTHGLGANDIHIHTKYVPDLAALPTLSPAQTEATVDRSRARLGLEQLDLVQFHWWDYRVPGYLETLETLVSLKAQGKIREVGVTNFDVAHLQEMVARGIPLASVQTQYSLLDRRPKAQLAGFAKEHAIALLCYGSIAGGLLSGHHLGASAPQEPHANRSLTKYLLILEELGGWEALQSLLALLDSIATERGSDVATLACAYALQQEAVRACIVGVKHTRHLAQHVALRDGFTLSERDLQRIETVRSHWPEVPGSVYELERDTGGRHGSIMKYNLNKEPA